MGESAKPKYAPRRPGEIDRICLDVSEAERLLGWKPEITPAGARRTVDYFKQAACGGGYSSGQPTR